LSCSGLIFFDFVCCDLFLTLFALFDPTMIFSAYQTCVPRGVWNVMESTRWYIRAALHWHRYMSAVHPDTALEARDSREIVEGFVLFCEKHGINFIQHDSAMKACVLLSLICPDVKQMCDALVPEVFIAWDSICMSNPVFGVNTTTWANVMQFFELDTDVADETLATAAGFPMPTALCAFVQILKQSSISVTYEHAARLFVLCNVRELPMSVVVTHYNKKHNAATTSTPAQVQPEHSQGLARA
jgi:hypothetical protein